MNEPGNLPAGGAFLIESVTEREPFIYEDFTDEIAHPAQYGLTNVTTPTCSDTGFPATCIDAQLDATPGQTAGWWQTYAFSNSFHPTPFGHQLLAASVSRALARAGWL